MQIHSRAGKLFTLLALAAVPAALGQQGKPRVYISGTGNVDVRTDAGVVGGPHWAVGSSHSTVGAHNQTMELAKDFSNQCRDVTVTLSQADADYTVGLNHEAFHGVIHKNNQVMVTNRRGDLVFSNTTRSVSHSTKDSCAAILADWKANGRIEVPAVPVAPQIPAAASATTPAKQTTTGTTTSTQPSMQVVSVPQTESLGDVARRLREQKSAGEQQSRPKATSQPGDESQQDSTLSTVAFRASPDGADISVDGKYVGSVPSTIRLRPGEHTIVIEKPDYAVWQRTLSVASGAVLTVNATLEKRP